MSDLERRRDEFAVRLERLRGALESEFGRAPRSGRWVLPLAAVGVGLLAAFGLKRRLSRKRLRTVGRG